MLISSIQMYYTLSIAKDVVEITLQSVECKIPCNIELFDFTKCVILGYQWNGISLRGPTEQKYLKLTVFDVIQKRKMSGDYWNIRKFGEPWSWETDIDSCCAEKLKEIALINCTDTLRILKFFPVYCFDDDFRTQDHTFEMGRAGPLKPLITKFNRANQLRGSK